MKTAVLLILNGALIVLFYYLIRNKGLLTYYHGGRIWLTWFSVAIITLMDELTSVFYAPAEAFRFIGPSAIMFIAFTSIFVHYMTTRLVEIAEILEHHKIFGGGVYSFSYLVLGPVASFAAVASIMVDYILTACISSVSAVENSGSFFALSHSQKMAAVIIIIWAIAGLNITGIRENVRFTFGIFVLAAVVLLNLVASGLVSLDSASVGRLGQSFTDASERLHSGSVINNYGIFIASVASCILAYSGVESVLQTAGLVRTWREIGRSYIFLAVSVGLVTPILAALALSAPIDFKAHEGDLITFYASTVNGKAFGVAVGTLASLTLIMAVNTAFVASSELLERVAERYGFHWLIATNRRHSLYRIHILSACAYTGIVLITAGSQSVLADMYALGLVASFCINMGALLIYRYFMGTKEVIDFHTSRMITLIMWVILMSCFAFLAFMKPHGTQLWALVTGVVLAAGLLVARTRAPEIRQLALADSQMDMVLYLAQSQSQEIHLFFRRPREESIQRPESNEAFITLYSPRMGAPVKMSENHYRFPARTRSVYQHMIAILKTLEYDFAHCEVTVHFGWPLSSWLDRLSIGVMVFHIMRLPLHFPGFKFVIEYPGKPYGHPAK